MKNLGLYIHIPFCESKCTYCDFNSGYELEEKNYLSAILKELEFYAPTFKNHLVETVFLGGGTPSLYSTQSLKKILEKVFSNYHLENPEITIECNPNSLTLEKLEGFKKTGFNRVSLGAQSFQNNQLKNLTRLHSSNHIVKALENIRKAGFTNFSFDLMYGLPDQSFNDFISDLTQALSFSPPHFSFYNLTLEKSHPLSSRLPSNETCTKMHLESKKILEKAGYEHYEISNYAKPGFKSQHNLKYWRLEEYLGIGAGAASYLETKPPWANQNIPYGIRFMGMKSPEKYSKTLLKNLVPAENIEYLSRKQALSDTLMNKLRLNEGLCLNSLNSKYHIDFTHDFPDFIQKQKKRGLLDIHSNMLRLNNKGRLFLDEILIDFI